MRDLRRRFWDGFRAFVAAKPTPLAISASDRGSHALLCGTWPGGFQLWAYANMRNRRLAVSLYSKRPGAKEQFRLLREHTEDVEAVVGAPLIWSGLAGMKGFEILLRNPVDPADESQWPVYFDWLRRTLESFQRAFGPLVRPFAPADGAAHEVEGISENHQFRLDYWTALRDRLVRSGSVLKPRKPRPEHWTSFALGRAGVHLSAIANRKHGWIAVELYFHGRRRRALFGSLNSQRAAIEAELGEKLEWFADAGSKHSKVRLRRLDSPPDDRRNWPMQHEWLQNQLEAFHRVFVPRIMAFNPEESDLNTTEDQAH